MEKILKLRAVVPELFLGDPERSLSRILEQLELGCREGRNFFVFPADIWGEEAVESLGLQRVFTAAVERALTALSYWSQEHPEVLILMADQEGPFSLVGGDLSYQEPEGLMDLEGTDFASWRIYLTQGAPWLRQTPVWQEEAQLLIQMAAGAETAETVVCGEQLRRMLVAKYPQLGLVYCHQGLGAPVTDGVSTGQIEIYDGSSWRQSPLLDFSEHSLDGDWEQGGAQSHTGARSLPTNTGASQMGQGMGHEALEDLLGKLEESLDWDEERQLLEVDSRSLDRPSGVEWDEELEELGFVEEPDMYENPESPEALPFYASARELELQRQMQAYGLAARVRYIGEPDLVLGLSGGLDSTQALLAAVRAMELLGRPATAVHALLLPGLGTSTRTYENSRKLAEALGVRTKEISIREAVLQHFKDLGHDPQKQDLTYENSQARERTQILMDYANMVGALVVGTGDLSELALGWCTYNGDHMAMYGVNGTLSKTLIRQQVLDLAGTYSRSSDPGRKALGQALEDIVSTPVSPELLPPDAEGKIRQKTEEAVGPYVLTDFFLYHTLRRWADPEEVLARALKAFSAESIRELDQQQRQIAGSELRCFSRAEILGYLRIFYRRFIQQQYKRSCMPDGVAVTSYSLSPRVADAAVLAMYSAGPEQIHQRYHIFSSTNCRFPSEVHAQLWERELDRLEAEG